MSSLLVEALSEPQLLSFKQVGCSDAIMIERSELTSGSTWHAAGGIHNQWRSKRCQTAKYTIELYKEIEKLSGQDIGLHMTGGIMLTTEERFDWLKSVRAKGKYLGMDELIITPQRAQELLPLIDPNQFVGAMYDPIEGHVDPTELHMPMPRRHENGASYETMSWSSRLTICRWQLACPY